MEASRIAYLSEDIKQLKIYLKIVNANFIFISGGFFQFELHLYGIFRRTELFICNTVIHMNYPQ